MTVRLYGEQHAALHGLAVEMDRAGSAHPLVGAADMSTGERELLTQEIHQ